MRKKEFKFLTKFSCGSIDAVAWCFSPATEGRSESMMKCIIGFYLLRMNILNPSGQRHLCLPEEYFVFVNLLMPVISMF